jgi:hypothetical protein
MFHKANINDELYDPMKTFSGKISPEKSLSPLLEILMRYHRRHSPQLNRHYSAGNEIKILLVFLSEPWESERNLRGEKLLPAAPSCCILSNYLFHSFCRPFFTKLQNFLGNLFKILRIEFLFTPLESRHFAKETTLKFHFRMGEARGGFF